MPELDLDLWLKPEDIEPEQKIEFIDAGKRGSIPQGEGEEPIPTFEIGVKLLDGTSRVWTMNQTSQRAVAQTYGVHTESWVGKSVLVYTVAQNVRGTQKKVIYARVPKP